MKFPGFLLGIIAVAASEAAGQSPPPTLSVPAVSDSGVYTVSFTRSSSPYVSTFIERRRDGGSWQFLAGPLAGTSHHENVSANGTYSYRARGGFQPLGYAPGASYYSPLWVFSSYSAEKSVVVSFPPVPGVPSHIGFSGLESAGTDTSGSFAVQWGLAAGEGITRYELQQRAVDVSDDGWSPLYRGTATRLSQSRGRGRYTYRVRACGILCGDWRMSPVVSVSLPPYPPNSFPLEPFFSQAELAVMGAWPYPADFVWPGGGTPHSPRGLPQPWPEAYCTTSGARYKPLEDVLGDTMPASIMVPTATCIAEAGPPRVGDDEGVSVAQLSEALEAPVRDDLIRRWLAGGLDGPALGQGLKLKGGQIVFNRSDVDLDLGVDRVDFPGIAEVDGTVRFAIRAILTFLQVPNGFVTVVDHVLQGIQDCSVSIIDRPDVQLQVALLRSRPLQLDWNRDARQIELRLGVEGYGKAELRDLGIRGGCGEFFGAFSMHFAFYPTLRLVVPYNIDLRLRIGLEYELRRGNDGRPDQILVRGTPVLRIPNGAIKGGIASVDVRVGDVDSLETLFHVDDKVKDAARDAARRLEAGLQDYDFKPTLQEWRAEKQRELDAQAFEVVYDLPTAESTEAIDLLYAKLELASAKKECLKDFVRARITDLSFADLAGERDLWGRLREEAGVYNASCS